MAGAASAREQIRIVGSATVYPFVTAAAEQFGMAEKFRTPIVESTGTGGGFKLFCSGVGAKFPDIVNASRKITASEVELCKKNAVTDIMEVSLGYDGIVLASKKESPHFSLTKKQVFMALARELPKDGAWIKNPYQKWNDIDARLPDLPIIVYGPPPTSGTRDAFGELVMEEGCKAFPEFVERFPKESERKKNCHVLREDDTYIEYGDDGNVLVQKLKANERALGILGFGFYDENSEQVQASTIDGVIPAAASIASGQYGMSRELYVYVKKQNIDAVPGIPNFLRELTSENAVGEDGYITLKGLLPLPQDRRAEIARQITSMVKH